MHLVIGLAAFAGFLLSLAVHACALSGIDVQARFAWVWLLHGGVFVVFFPFVFSMRKTFGETMTFAAMRAAFPAWVVVAGTCVFAYTLINFALVMMAREGSNVLIENGKYLLFAQGEPARELSLAQYSAFRANDMRGFSGHWLVFYFMPFVYFLFRRPMTPARASEDGA